MREMQAKTNQDRQRGKGKGRVGERGKKRWWDRICKIVICNSGKYRNAVLFSAVRHIIEYPLAVCREHRSIVRYRTIKNGTVQNSTLRYSTVQDNTIQHSAAKCLTWILRELEE